MLTTEVIERLRGCLLALERAADAPRLDAEWLRVRCDDTLGYSGQLRRDSIRQLKKDVEQFVQEFPSLLPEVLIDELNKMEV